MNEIIRSLNLNDGEVLTLEKLQARMEFEAFALPGEDLGNKDVCAIYIECVLDCNSLCSELVIRPCSCDGPDGYIHCHPYTG